MIQQLPVTACLVAQFLKTMRLYQYTGSLIVFLATVNCNFNRQVHYLAST